ncbi:MAG: undecaprenyl-diphosphate phosphatase [Rickettsiales bacterium]|nr:undecaprenyl-diphosphate phosphatase [Rickettsiales bacterium]
MITDLFKTIFLGIIEGLTEFIPVSSTAHLLIASYLIDFQSIKNNLFEIVIQVGAIFAVCIIYRKKIFDVIFNLNQKNQQKFSINLALAFLPAVFFGALFHDLIKQFLFSTFVIAISLIIGGVIMIIVEYTKRKSETNNIDDITFSKALYIGLFQCLAMIPGISRSGATIIGGLLLKLDRKTATEFSFFLAIPTIFAATVYDLSKNISTLTFSNVELLLIGTLSAFISAIFVIKWFLSYVSKNNFVIFGVYRIIVGIVILIFIV